MVPVKSQRLRAQLNLLLCLLARAVVHSSASQWQKWGWNCMQTGSFCPVNNCLDSSSLFLQENCRIKRWLQWVFLLLLRALSVGKRLLQNSSPVATNHISTAAERDLQRKKWRRPFVEALEAQMHTNTAVLLLLLFFFHKCCQQSKECGNNNTLCVRIGRWFLPSRIRWRVTKKRKKLSSVYYQRMKVKAFTS